MARQFDVFLFEVPEPDQPGIQAPDLTWRAATPGPSPETQRFDTLDAARRFAEQSKGRFNRITINVASPEKPTLVERYSDGQHEVVKTETDLDAVESAAVGESEPARA
jgi:hypothetical protein